MFKTRLNIPVFYEATLTGSRYWEILKDIVFDILKDFPLRDLRNVWFGQLSTTQVIKYPTIHSGHISVTRHRVHWLCRITFTFTWPEHIGFFLWGYIKQRVYAIPPPTLQQFLKHNMDVRINITCHVVKYIAVCSISRYVLMMKVNHFE